MQPMASAIMESVTRSRRKTAMRKSKDMAYQQLFNTKKFTKEIIKSSSEKGKPRTKSILIGLRLNKRFWDFMPHSKEEEEELTRKRIADMKKNRMDLGKVVFKMLSHPVKNSKKNKRIGRRGQQVQ